uniref:Uncharacterized protein n=1 Tax=Anguilla anguilla TaxID=7936 RepID=A0A0E9WUY7_ANGAN
MVLSNGVKFSDRTILAAEAVVPACTTPLLAHNPSSHGRPARAATYIIKQTAYLLTHMPFLSEQCTWSCGIPHCKGFLIAHMSHHTAFLNAWRSSSHAVSAHTAFPVRGHF